MSRSRVLITGSSGFIGSALYNQLKSDFEVSGLSRKKSADLNCDLTIEKPSLPDFDFVIHAAGLAHIMFDDSKSMLLNNFDATSNLLNGLDPAKLKGFIFISSVAVYGFNSGEGIDESYTPIPTDSYADSKYQAEQIILNWCSKHDLPFLILRLPLVVGVNAPGNINRLKHALRKGRFFLVNKNQSKRSMILLDDLLGLIHHQIKKGIIKSGVYNLSDGDGVKFNDFVLKVCHDNGYNEPIKLPYWLVKIFAYIGSFLGGKSFSLSILDKMTQSLTFSSQKARQDLHWSPRPVLNDMRRAY